MLKVSIETSDEEMLGDMDDILCDVTGLLRLPEQSDEL